MPRRRPADRLDELLRAARRVFLVKGYRRSRMADIALEMGVSSGLLYTYVASKEALFHLLVDRMLATEAPPPAFPVATPKPGETERLVRRVHSILESPVLAEALERSDVEDARAEVEEIVREHYRTVHRWRRLIALIERSALDLPQLAEHWYVKGRRPAVARLTRYIERRVASGHFRAVPDASTAARFVVEVVAWFANHRYGDRDSRMIDDSTAEKTVVHMVASALVKP